MFAEKSVIINFCDILFQIKGADHDGGHLAEKFLKNYCFYPELSRLLCRDLAVVTRRCLAIRFLTFKCL